MPIPTAPTDEDQPGPILHLLIDTCVWLDVAKDYRQRATVAALEQMIASGAVQLIVPRQVIDEFERNKGRVATEASRSLSSTFIRVKDAMAALGGSTDRAGVMAQLDDAQFMISSQGQAAGSSLDKVEALLRASTIIETSDAAKVRAAERALHKRAPFHKGKNSIGDAIIIEVYAEAAHDVHSDDVVAFVTHNKHDFGDNGADERKAHPDIAILFDDKHSIYRTNLAQLLNDFAPEWMDDLKFEYEWQQEPRLPSEILAQEELLFRQVWYNRHMVLRQKIEDGRVTVVADADYSRSPYKPTEILDTVWAMALDAAKRAEDEVGLENLGPWDDFEWGVLNGKLSALRWVLGDEWDMLDT